MKARTILFLVPLIIGKVYAQVAPILVTPAWLHDHQKDANIVLIQVNFLKLDYNKEHITNARFLWPEYMTPDTPEANYNAPDPEKA